MNLVGLSRVVAAFMAVAVIVAITAFLGGMYLGGWGAPQASPQTITIPLTVTVRQTITQSIASIPITSAQQPITLPSKIVVGLPISLSGSQADPARRGFWGIMAAVNWVNQVYGGVHLYGKAIPLEIKYYDDESKKENVIAYTERLITVDKVNFLLGAYSSPLAFPQAPIAEKYKMLLVMWADASDLTYSQGYKYVVGIMTPATKYMSMALDALKSVNPGAKIAILYKDDEFNRIVGSSVSAEAKKLGFSVIYEKIYPPDINDFSPYITDLAKSGADALIVSSHAPDGQLFTKQLADAGVNFKFITINIAPCLSSYYDTLKNLAEGILCPSQWEPGVKYTPDLAKSIGVEWFGPTTDEFMKFFVNVTGNPNIIPSYHTAAGAAAILTLVKAIETAQSLDPTAVREAFNKLYLMTFFGLFKIDPATGKQVAHEMVLGQWQAGKFVVVWPPNIAEKKLYYPIPTWDEKRAGKVASY